MPSKLGALKQATEKNTSFWNFVGSWDAWTRLAPASSFRRLFAALRRFQLQWCRWIARSSQQSLRRRQGLDPMFDRKCCLAMAKKGRCVATSEHAMSSQVKPMLEEVLQYGGLYCALTSREARSRFAGPHCFPDALSSTDRALQAQDPWGQRTLGQRPALLQCQVPSWFACHGRSFVCTAVLPKP